MRRLFASLSTGRRLWIPLGVALIAGAAMIPAMATMANHGASLTDFETPGTVERADQILTAWGGAGETAMWWQLALDVPFILGFSLFLAAACTAVARRAASASMPRLERVAHAMAWLGPLAGALDLTQDVCSVVMLSGHVAQPWPRLSTIAISFVAPLAALAGLFALGGYLATRRALRDEPRTSAQPG